MGRPTEAQREAKAQLVAPKAVEQPPKLSDWYDKLMGRDERADTLAGQIADCILMARNLEGEMRRFGHPPEHRIPGWGPEEDGKVEDDHRNVVGDKVVTEKRMFRSYKQQFGILNDAIGEAWSQAEAEECDQTVKDKVPEKIKAALARGEQALDAQAANPG